MKNRLLKRPVKFWKLNQRCYRSPAFYSGKFGFCGKTQKKQIPYVFIDSDIPEQGSLTYIGPDVKQSAYIAAKLLHTVVQKNDDVLILNMVKGIENAAALKRMEAGFRDFYRENSFDEDVIHTLTINSTDRETVFRELTKFYIKNQHIKGVFVTNSKAYLVSGFHVMHELDTRVVGFDLVKENVEHLKSGGIDYLISQSPLLQGMKAFQTLFELFVYKNKPHQTQYVPLDIIIRENVDFYINFQ
jgi:LacI family transcriptional regulator